MVGLGYDVVRVWCSMRGPSLSGGAAACRKIAGAKHPWNEPTMIWRVWVEESTGERGSEVAVNAIEVDP
jgi:hypothetical protein